MYGYIVWCNGLKYTKTCCSFYMKQNLKLKTFKTICNHDVGNNFNYNSRFIFQNINNVLFNRPLSLKV
jgi:hypothetical protein